MLGVYFIHENNYVRSKLYGWLGLLSVNSSKSWFIFYVFLMTIVIFVVCTLGYGVFIKNKKFIITAATVAILYIIASVACSPLISYSAHRNLIGNIEEVEFSSQIEYMDTWVYRIGMISLIIADIFIFIAFIKLFINSIKPLL